MPGWGVYHEYQNFDVEDPKQDVEADGGLHRLFESWAEKTQPKVMFWYHVILVFLTVTLVYTIMILVAVIVLAMVLLGFKDPGGPVVGHQHQLQEAGQASGMLFTVQPVML